jgi:uncharacterized protein YggE
MAIDNAKKTANELSSAVGVKLGKLIYINVYSSGSAVPLYDVKGYGVGGGAGSVPTSSGQLVLTVTADLTYEIK